MLQETAKHRYSAISERVYKRCRSHALLSGFFVIEIGYDEDTHFHPVSKTVASDEQILVYVVKGKGSYGHKKRLYKVEEDDFFVLPVRSLTALESTQENPWSIYWAFFAGTRAPDVTRFLMGRDPGPRKAKSLVGRVAQFNDILHHLDLMQNIENLVYLNSRFYSFVCSFKLKVLAARKHGRKDRAIHTIEYMRDNIGKAISLEELAEVAGLSVSHYCAVFKKRTSQTPMQLFTSMKIQRACQWLQNRNQTIKSVAYDLGFFDQYHFSRVFKEIMGVSPRVFRKGKAE